MARRRTKTNSRKGSGTRASAVSPRQLVLLGQAPCWAASRSTLASSIYGSLAVPSLGSVGQMNRRWHTCGNLGFVEKPENAEEYSNTGLCAGCPFECSSTRLSVAGERDIQASQPNKLILPSYCFILTLTYRNMSL
jgi:hypothetical protein